MARHMAGDAEAFRAVVRYTYLGPDVTYDYGGKTYFRYRHGQKTETVFGPYSKPSTALGVLTSETNHMRRENEHAMLNGEPPLYELDPVIQKAETVWKDWSKEDDY